MLLILLLLFILWLVAVPAYAWTQIARVDAAPSGQRPLINQARRSVGGLGLSRWAQQGRAEAARDRAYGGQRTDSIMLIYLPPGGKSALICVS